MSCRLWVMLIFIIVQLKTKIMAFNYLENCFYEKRINVTLHGYNDVHDRWLSDFDCFDRCLRIDTQKCHSFEHWRRNGYGICVRTNISLSDRPSITRSNPFVDYYEIHCRKDNKVLKPSSIHCPDDRLFVTVQLNGIDPNDVLLGDRNCKANSSNETHAQFISHINHCSLTLINDSIVGKIRWKHVHRHNNSVKQYERFFVCQPSLDRIRLIHRTSTTGTHLDHKNTLSTPSYPYSIYNDEQQMISSNKITIAWTLHNRSHFCPETCCMPLYSFINITFDDLSQSSTKFFIDSCDLVALYPYATYVQSRRLIYQGCPIDPTVIEIPINSFPFSIHQFSFYLYHIIKEPIPFQIQCKILYNDDQIEIPNNTDCSTSFINNNHNDRLSIHKNDKRDYVFRSYHSSKVCVTRPPAPSDKIEREKIENPFSSIAAVHYTKCCLLAFFIIILNAI